MNRVIYPASSYPLSGDVQSQPGSPSTAVVGIQGVPVTQVTLGGGEVLTYDGTVGAWVPKQLAIATVTSLGVIQPDGTTITIDPATGIISSAGGGGVARGALHSNSNGKWWVWGDGVIEQWGSVTVAPNSSNLSSVVVTFPTAFTTSVDGLEFTVNGTPRVSSADTATAQASSVLLTQVTVLLQCSVPTGGGGATFDQAVSVYWRAIGV